MNRYIVIAITENSEGYPVTIFVQAFNAHWAADKAYQWLKSRGIDATIVEDSI